MKKILLVDSSPREGGNSDTLTKTVADDLAACGGVEATTFTMRDQSCNPCRACAACQGKETQLCVQQDDITALLSLIDGCDAILLTTPIYNQQVNSQAKLFIERLYPFFNVKKPNMSNSSKQGKKAALACVCWGSPREAVQQYADWTVSGLSQMGAEHYRALVFDQIPNIGDIAKREDYLDQIHQLAAWLAE